MSDQIDYFSICRRSQTRTHSNTERQVAAQPLRMNINNINNAVAFHSTHPAIHITLDEFKNVKRTGSRAKFFFFIHYHVFKWESKHPRVWQLTLSLPALKKKAIFHWHGHRMIAPIAMVKDVYNSKWKSTAKVGKNSFTIIINEMIDLFGVKTNDFRPSCNSYLSV